MARRAEPKKGILYTFKFRNEKGWHYTTLLYEGINNKGRLEFYNYESKALTTMPAKRFSYIHRFNLVKEEPVKMEIKDVAPPLIIEQPIIEENEISNQEQKILHELRSLNENERKRVRITLARETDDLIKDVEICFNTVESELDRQLFSKTMNDLIKVGNVLGKKLFSA